MIHSPFIYPSLFYAFDSAQIFSKFIQTILFMNIFCLSECKTLFFTAQIFLLAYISGFYFKGPTLSASGLVVLNCRCTRREETPRPSWESASPQRTLGFGVFSLFSSIHVSAVKGRKDSKSHKPPRQLANCPWC